MHACKVPLKPLVNVTRGWDDCIANQEGDRYIYRLAKDLTRLLPNDFAAERDFHFQSVAYKVFYRACIATSFERPVLSFPRVPSSSMALNFCVQCVSDVGTEFTSAVR